MDKSEKKSGRRLFKPGPDPRRGTGPKKGAPNAGRPPDAFRARMRALADRAQVAAHLEKVLDGGPAEQDDHFWKALNYATDHGHGKPTQSVDVTAKGEFVQLVARAPRKENAAQWAAEARVTLAKLAADAGGNGNGQK